MNTPITYTVDTGHTEAETTFRIEACNTVLVSDSLSPHIGLSLLFCIASNCQFIRLICGNFIANVENKRWQLHSLHLLAWKKLIRLNLLVSHLFLTRIASKVRGFKHNETIQSKTLLSDHDGYLACKIENENLLVCLTNYFYEKCWLPITASAK